MISSVRPARPDLIKLVITLSLGLISLSGCTSFDRSRGSGYADRNDPAVDRRNDEREHVRSQLGYENGANAGEDESDAIDRRIRLARAEKNLDGKREREQYFKNKPYLKSDEDRIAFLALDSYETRQRWLQAKHVSTTGANNSPEIQYLVDRNDISIGMTKQAVRASWGEPDLVEAAGNPLYGNERWHYTEQTSSTEGYQTQKRLVYFDSGRVAGWESH